MLKKNNWYKKLLCVIICLLGVVFVVRNLLDELSFYIPNEHTVSLGTKDEEGNSYEYFSSSYSSGFYKCNNRDKVTASLLANQSTPWADGKVVALRYLKKTLYMLHEKSGIFTFYAFDTQFETQKSVPLEFEEAGVFGGLSDDGKILYLSVIRNSGKSVYVYRLDSSEKAPKSMYSEDAPEGLRYLSAYYNQGVIEAKFSDGTTTENYETMSRENIVIPESTKMFALTSGIGYIIRDVLLLAIGVFFVIFAYSMIVNKKSYIWRRFVIVILMSAICTVSVSMFVYYIVGGEREGDVVKFMHVCGRSIGDEISKSSDDYEVLFSNRNQLELVRRVETVIGENGNYTIRSSTKNPTGSSVRELYGDDVCDAIYRATSNGEAHCTIVSSGFELVVTVDLIPGDVSRSSFVLTIGDNGEYVEKEYNDMMRILIVECIIWCLGMIGVFANLIRDALEIRRVIKVMENVCNGKSPEIERPNNVSYDYAKLWNSLGELNKTIGKNNYARNQIFQAYYRFAPKNIEKLLEKDNIGEVKSGDMLRINGVVGTVVISRPVVRSQNEYLDSLNSSIETVCRYQTEFGGVLLPNDCSLGSVKVLFTEKSDSSVEFGIQTAAALESASFSTRQQSLVFLHRTNFFYGIAGTDNQAFPCISSTELDGIDSYIGRLAELGIKLAVTEQVLESTARTLNTRYIGYLELKSSATKIKVYEVIDACNIRERKTKTETKELFARGIELFYKNDFYLARNAFTDVLKLSPGDMVAKWYLFTCERQLNNLGGEEFSYGLLSSDNK